jgi:hypothetical protein
VPLVPKRASTSRPSGQRSDSDFDVLADGGVVGRIMKAAAAPARTSWMWTLMFDCHEDRTPTRGYEPNALKCREHRGSKYDETNQDPFRDRNHDRERSTSSSPLRRVPVYFDLSNR